MDRDKLDKLIEYCILGLIVAVLAFGALATGAVRGQDFAVLQGLTIVAIALWVARLWVNPGHRLQWPPACWAVVGFVVYAVVRYWQADVEYVARNELVRILVYAAVFFIVLNNLHRQETTRLLFGAILILAVLIAMYAVYQFLADSPNVWHFTKPRQYHGRGSGTFICPNHLAGFLEMLLPISMAVVVLSRRGALSRVWNAYVTLVLLAGIGVSVSRGGWLACGAALVLASAFLLRYRHYRRRAMIALGIIVVLAGLFVWKARSPQKRFSLIFTPGQLEHGGSRPLLWGPAWRMWKDHPWFGVGPAHFDVRFPAYRTRDVQSRPLWVHNDYLNAMADWGVLGAVLIGGFVVCLALGVARTWKYVGRGSNDLAARGSDRAARVLGISTGLVALLLHSVVDFNMQIPANALLAIVIMANLTSHLRFATDRYWVSLRWYGRVAITAVGLVVIWHLGGRVVGQYREGVLLARAQAATTAAVQVGALDAAFRLEPRNPETVARIGEIVRLQSWEGGPQWRQLAEAATSWFELGVKLNPYDAYCYLRYGMCLDWLGRHPEATAWFDKALKVDPISYYVTLMRGWHEIQKGDNAAAKVWLEKSIEIKWYDNQLANTYLAIVNERLARDAASTAP